MEKANVLGFSVKTDQPGPLHSNIESSTHLLGQRTVVVENTCVFYCWLINASKQSDVEKTQLPWKHYTGWFLYEYENPITNLNSPTTVRCKRTTRMYSQLKDKTIEFILAIDKSVLRPSVMVIGTSIDLCRDGDSVTGGACFASFYFV